MKKTIGGNSFTDRPEPKSMDEMRTLLSGRNGAEQVMKEFTERYPLMIASAHLNLMLLHAQGDNCRELSADEQKKLEAITDAINELLMAVFHFCEEREAQK